METRLLKYYLKVAQVGNITQAAHQLHITQPTLSRQLTKLENEVGVKLLNRTNHQLSLTEAGIIFERRAQQILGLLSDTKREITASAPSLTGLIKVGCVESKLSVKVAEWLNGFQQRYPQVQFELYGADGDDLKEKLDTNRLDFAFLIEPIEAAKYNYLTLPYYENWGVFVNKNHPLASKKQVKITDLADQKIIMTRRNIVKAETNSWLASFQELTPKIFMNLPNNTNLLILNHGYCAIGIEGILTVSPHPDLCFLPIFPPHHSGHVLAWRKNFPLTPLTEKFLAYVKDSLN